MVQFWGTEEGEGREGREARLEDGPREQTAYVCRARLPSFPSPLGALKSRSKSRPVTFSRRN